MHPTPSKASGAASSRRRCRQLGFLFLALGWAVPGLPQQLPQLSPTLSPPPREMLRNFLHDIARQQLASRRAAIAQIRTAADVQRRQAEVRAIVLKLMGGLPGERTPLNLRRTGALDRGDYRVEKVVYESLPNFYVTASLYIPKTGSPPYPAVLQPVGHSQTGKARGLYQSLSIGLVKNGFVVLTYDPIGQGERTIFYDERIQTSLVGSATREHQMVGVQSLLAGESVARYRLWDGIRGIDLLASLPEVDRRYIGVAGCSGGGTLTTYIAALDDRVQAAAPACYISSWEEQLPGTGPQDAEQQFPGQLSAGIDHADYIIAFAPKPYLICSTTEDFFPLAGAQRTFEEVRRIYRILGAEEKIQHFVGPGGHGMRRDTREAIYAWMNRWLKHQPPGPVTEPEHTIEHDEDLYATPTGQVATSLGGETAGTWNIKSFSAIRPPAVDLATSAGLEHHRRRVRDAVVKLTRYQPPSGPLNTRTQSRAPRDGYKLELLVYDAEPGRYIPAFLCTPAPGRPRRGTVVYLDDAGKAAGFRRAGDAAQLCALGYSVLAPDLSGLGDTAPDWGSYSSEWFGSDKLTWLALMVGRPLLGLRMADVVRSLDLLADRDLLHNGAALGFAKGKAGVVLLHTAVVDSRLSGLLLEDVPVSYRAIAETPIHRRIFDAVLPGVLGQYDLEDLAAAIAPRPVALVNVRSPLGRLMLTAKVREHYPRAAAAYQTAGAAGVFRIGLRREAEPAAQAFPELENAGPPK